MNKGYTEQELLRLREAICNLITDYIHKECPGTQLSAEILPVSVYCELVTMLSENKKVFAIKHLWTVISVSMRYCLSYVPENKFQEYLDDENISSVIYVATLGLKETKNIIGWIQINDPILRKARD